MIYYYDYKLSIGDSPRNIRIITEIDGKEIIVTYNNLEPDIGYSSAFWITCKKSQQVDIIVQNDKSRSWYPKKFR